MKINTLLTFFVVASIVWGGFIFFLVKAIKFEKNKKIGK